MKKIIIVFIAIFLVHACTTVQSSNGIKDAQPNLVNTQWQLLENVEGKIPTLVFEMDKISGNAGCNNFFGTTVISPKLGGVSMQNLGSTKMACKNLEAEQSYLNLLSKVNKYKVNGEVLELYKDQLLLLKFNRK